MRLSLNEVEVTLKKAAMGAGYATGLAEDTGRACFWLAERGLDAARAGAAALQSPAGGGGGELGDGCLRFAAARVVRDGPSALDLLLSGDASSVELEAADAPLLLVGLAGVAAAVHGVAWRLVHAAGALVIGGDGVDGAMPKPGAMIRLTRLAEATPTGIAPQTGGCEVGDADWAAITALAARLLVPESDASRQAGAGAGAIDND
ncbi:MAG: DUF3726 domain-containing protein [Rhodobacteraceae bacterium]|nr:DUF3726 domain-containing protein [Paracoccaceae bacterium]